MSLKVKLIAAFIGLLILGAMFGALRWQQDKINKLEGEKVSLEKDVASRDKTIENQNKSIENYQLASTMNSTNLRIALTVADGIRTSSNTAVQAILTQKIPQDCKGAVDWARGKASEFSKEWK